MERFQIESDIHLEMVSDSVDLSKFMPRKSSAQYLIVAGDICPVPTHTSQLVRFLTYCATSWEKTFIVAGNHEYYNGLSHEPMSAEQCDQVLRHMTGLYNNVHFLQRDVVMLGSIAICGCTLWSNTTQAILLRDYDRIFNHSLQRITHLDTLQWHEEDVEWLNDAITAARDTATHVLVITHHMPSNSIVPARFKDELTTLGFASDLDQLVERADFWVCGHGHDRIKTKIGDCTVVMNPRGYPGENVYKPCVLSINTA